MSSIVVMKFGSSVLADESQLGAVSDEIYRALREGLRVVAVVSALGDTTDELDCTLWRLIAESRWLRDVHWNR